MFWHFGYKLTTVKVYQDLAVAGVNFLPKAMFTRLKSDNQKHPKIKLRITRGNYLNKCVPFSL